MAPPAVGGSQKIKSPFQDWSLRGLRPLPRRNDFLNAEVGPNEHSFGVVYVNEAARDVFGRSPSATFPPGAIIVREKLPAVTSITPDLIAVMIKREPGFNPKANDWEFAVVSSVGKRVTHREKTGSCQKCHSSEAKSDFVFRAQYQ